MEDARDPHDNYETPPAAVHQLLSNVALRGGVLDPSCGRGNIVKVLLDAGFAYENVAGADKHRHALVDESLSDACVFGLDFLTTTVLRPDFNIVMNPPFDQADGHVRHALRIIPRGGYVCVLLRLTWMAAQKRSDLLKHLWKIIMVGRLKMLPPDVPDQGHGGTVDFAWFVFVNDVFSATTIVRAR